MQSITARRPSSCNRSSREGTSIWAKNSESWVGHLNLGNAYVKTGRFEDAIDHSKKAIELQPQFAGGYINLGAEFRVVGRSSQFGECLCKNRQVRRCNRSQQEGHRAATAVRGRLHQSGRRIPSRG